jgi:hypothetical protein
MSRIAIVAAVAALICSPALAGGVIGLSEEQLITCAGMPARSIQAGASTFYEFANTHAAGGANSFMTGNSIQSFGYARVVGCVATVRITGGSVVDVQYQCRGLITGMIARSQMFANCKGRER